MYIPNIREFNSVDWVCLQGAEPFAENNPPLIIDEYESIKNITLIADNSGITILHSNETDCTEVRWVPKTDSIPFWNQESARVLLLSLSGRWANMSAEELIADSLQLGFRLQRGFVEV